MKLTLVLVALAVFATSAHAIVLCTTPDGKTYAGDQPPPDCTERSRFEEEPSRSSASPPASAATTETVNSAATTATDNSPHGTACLELSDAGSSVLSANSSYVEMSWKVSIRNKCDETLRVRAGFEYFDGSDFKLGEDSERVVVKGHDTEKVSGITLVSPIEKAKRIKRANATAVVY